MRLRYRSFAVGTLIAAALLITSTNGRPQTRRIIDEQQRSNPRIDVRAPRSRLSTVPPAQQKPRIVATKKSPVQLGELVGFSLEPEGLAARSHYTYEVDYGDSVKETINPNRQVLQHRYKSAGLFKVSVNTIPSATGASSAPAIESITIEVVHARLSVSPLVTEVGVPVQLRATSVSNDRTLRYRFSYGDGTQSDWRESGRMAKVYAVAGDYTAKVEVAFTDSLDLVDTVSSALIHVNAVDPASIRFSVNPPQVKANEPVTLSTRFDAKGRHIQYRFFYGDGKDSGWQDDVRQRYTYEEKPSEQTYEPYVEVGFLMDGGVYAIGTSNTQTVRVLAVQTSPLQSPTPTATERPTPSPPPPLIEPKILILILVGLLIIGALVALTRTLEKSFSNPKPTFTAFADAGTASMVQSSEARLVNFEVHVDPNLGEGSFDLITDGSGVIRSEGVNHG